MQTPSIKQLRSAVDRRDFGLGVFSAILRSDAVALGRRGLTVTDTGATWTVSPKPPKRASDWCAYYEPFTLDKSTLTF